MSCKNKPEVTCGDLISDACVTLSDPYIFKGCPKWVEDLLPDLECARQSDVNRFFGDVLCSIATTLGESDDTCPPNPSTGSGIQGSISLACLAPCNPDLGPIFSPAAAGNYNAKVNDEFQHVYGALCDLKTTLNTWTDLPLPQGFDLGCIGDKCCNTPPATLGELLSAMIAKICCITSNAVDAQGVVLNTPVTGACPNC